MDTKSKIYHTAAHLFAEKGYAGVSMREISTRSGVSKPTIYYYFKSKEGIYSELLRDGLEQIRENMSQIMQEDLTGLEKIKKALSVHFQQCKENPDLSQFYFMLSSLYPRYSFAKSFYEKIDENRTNLRTLVLAAIKVGEMHKGTDPDLVVELLLGISTHFSYRYIRENEAKDPVLAAEEIIDSLVNGFGVK